VGIYFFGCTLKIFVVIKIYCRETIDKKNNDNYGKYDSTAKLYYEIQRGKVEVFRDLEINMGNYESHVLNVNI
jgi:hypothetical protein